jgi:hypothetical protein
LRVHAGFGADEPVGWLVDELGAELAVHLGLVLGVSAGEYSADVAECVEQGLDLLLGHPGLSELRSPGRECLSFVGLDLRGPSCDQDGVGAGFEGLTVASEFRVAVGDRARDGEVVGRGDGVWLGCEEPLDSDCQTVRCEGLGQPVVEGREDVAFGEVDVAGMLDGVGERVLLRVAAAVVGLVVVPLALHAPGAAAAVQKAA